MEDGHFSAPKRHYFIPGKLVRDNVPRIAELNGDNLVIQIALDRIDALKRKLIEEAYEVAAEGQDLGLAAELADVLEVVDCLIEEAGLNRKEIQRIKDAKNTTRGSFTKGYLLTQLIYHSEKK